MLNFLLIIFISFNISNYVKEFYENPSSKNRVFNTIVSYYKSRGNYKEILDITEFGLKRHPDDWKLARYYCEALIRMGERDSAFAFARNYFKKKRPVPAYRAFYNLFYFNGKKNLALDILRSGRKVYHSDSLFAREFYYDNLWNKNFQNAFHELLNFYLATRSLTLLRQEFGRIEKFLDEKNIKNIVSEWIRKHPDHREVRIILADYYMRHKRPDMMMRELRLSGYNNNLTEFARYMISIGKYASADSLLNMEKKRNGKWFFLKGIILAKLGKFKKSKYYLIKAYKTYRISEAGDSLVSICFFKLKDYDTVIKYSSPTNKEYRFRALLALSRDSEFLTEVKRDKSDKGLYFAGYYFFIIGKPDSARMYWNRLVKNFPESPLLFKVFFYRELQDVFGNNKEMSILRRIDSLLLRNMIDEARALISENIENDTLGLVRFEFARMLLLKGNYNDAFAEFKRIGDLTHNFLSPYSYYQAYLIARKKLNDADLAKSVAEKVIDKYPESPYAAAMRSLL